MSPPGTPSVLSPAVGEDCAGAVQFVRPERLEAIFGAVPPDIEWLTEANIDTGQFSLAAAQPKTAWFIPTIRPYVWAKREPLWDNHGHGVRDQSIVAGGESRSIAPTTDFSDLTFLPSPVFMQMQHLKRKPHRHPENRLQNLGVMATTMP
jgi:hypothetical protein